MAGVWFRVFPPEPEAQVAFEEDVGPKDMPERDARPFEYFKLFMTTNLIREICRQTNK